MAATRRNFNWTAVGFTPSGGTLATATGVTNVAVAMNGTLAKFSGDGDHYPTTVINEFNDPTVTVTTADEAWASAVQSGTRGVLTATHKDAKNATGGNITFTLANAVAVSPDIGGAHRQFGSATLAFSAESVDGITNPIAVSVA